MRTVEGDGWSIEWDSDGDGFARLVVKAAADPQHEVAGDWLPEDRWFAYEYSGPSAVEDALKAALDDLWPDRTPYRIP